ncbi:hypothetical protein [Faucicola boevrei]|uniref:hypothetical protein n=1 Tax=Faucicola boevrei TaxID=346665 RepID=UPI00035E27C1|nr:hypothetical protein [Moraxella boevrei]
MKSKTQKSLIKLGKQLAKNPNLIAQSQKPIKPRNYLALNPLLQKGGLHDKDDVVLARKKQRRQCKQDLRRTDWFNQSDV